MKKTKKRQNWKLVLYWVRILSKGLFISFEGADGAGKTVQAASLVKYLKGINLPVVAVREPGGTKLGERVRSILKNVPRSERTQHSELFLFLSARAQLVQQVIKPALAQNKIVIADRFHDSTTVYQTVSGLDEKMVKRTNDWACEGVFPHLTLLLDVDPKEGFSGITKRGGKIDPFEAEGLAFQKKVRAGYLKLAKAQPKRVKLIKRLGTEDDVFEALLPHVLLELDKRGYDLGY